MNANDADNWRRIKSILADALEVPAPEREAIVRARCGQDDRLGARVRELLALESTAGATAETGPEEAAHEWLGHKVGPYQIEGWLHSGGFGQVYLATRVDDIRRRVAIKFLLPEANDEQFRRRFRAEMQYLALLNHPNIVTLLDAGTAAGDRPYYVMEYIEGLPIGRHCAAHHLPVRRRLELFIQVCEAVYYAHTHLLIHRDLKPANILVTTGGQVKVLDFGIAKLIRPELLNGAEPVTLRFLHPMTPAYASPEQLRREPLTTSSDIYSLGVILYELLSGTVPFSPGREPNLETSVSKKDPLRPSEAAKQAPATEFQESDPVRLRRRLEGEIDNIVMKALRKEPDRRYASALDLAADIRNYLTGMPVKAQPDSLRYKAKKFLCRHWVGVASIAAVVAALALGLGMALYEWNRAEAARKLAEDRLTQVQSLTRSFEATLESIEKVVLPSAGAYQAVSDAKRRLADDSRNIALQAELSASYEVLCATLEQNGDLAGAIDMCKQAMAVRQNLQQLDPGNLQYKEKVSALQTRLSGLEMRQAESSRGSHIFGYAGNAAPMRGSPADASIGLALGYRQAGDVLRISGDLEGAFESYKSSVQLCEAALEADAKAQYLRQSIIESYTRLAAVARRLNRNDAVEKCEKRLKTLQ
jgi:tRNA A-37 threonylcarbamoyl transferase component Bud32/tetratricopeptide (TPR) repeat protein